MPKPESVAEAPREWLSWLADRITTGLVSKADPAAAMPYPLGPPAYGTNPYCVAYGTAGVVYALHRAGMPVDGRIVGRLVDSVMAQVDDLPPGLFAGTAGLAWVLADLGHIDAARKLLSVGDRHGITDQDCTLAHGSAGVALAHLALARHDGDTEHLSRAADLLADVPDGAAVIPLLGANESTGWAAGRSGIALALHYLSTVTGDGDAAGRGRAFLLDELAQSYTDGDGLQFHVSRKDRRVEPYLATGSAGFALAAARYLATQPGVDDPLADAYHRCLATIRSLRLPMLPSLFQGLSGMGLALSDLAAYTDAAHLRAAALDSGRALFQYAVPREGGVCFLGPGNRFTADLADGAAGVLLFLAQILDGRPNALFTLDSPGDPAPDRYGIEPVPHEGARTDPGATPHRRRPTGGRPTRRSNT